MASKKTKPKTAENKRKAADDQPKKSKTAKADSSQVGSKSARSKAVKGTGATKKVTAETKGGAHHHNGKPSSASVKNSREHRPDSRRITHKTLKEQPKKSERDGAGTKPVSKVAKAEKQSRSHQPEGGESSQPHHSDGQKHGDGMVLNLSQALGAFASSHRLGRIAHHMRFDWGEIENPDLQPELAYVSYDRWAEYRHVPSTLTWHVVPDLVVEIAERSMNRGGLDSRLKDYFRAGVARVWLIDPSKSQIVEYQSPSDSRTFQRDQKIEGGDIIPGFELSVKELAREDGE
jgi:Uma2 family endonuclease